MKREIRLLRYANGTCALHQVYTNEEGQPVLCDAPATFFGTPETIAQELREALASVEGQEPLDVDVFRMNQYPAKI